MNKYSEMGAVRKKPNPENC